MLRGVRGSPPGIKYPAYFILVSSALRLKLLAGSGRAYLTLPETALYGHKAALS
jgi:hypothetical protein